jgi:hypothetical protein
MQNLENNFKNKPKDRILGENINLDEKDILSLTEEEMLDAGNITLERRKEMTQIFDQVGLSYEKKEELSGFFPSNMILNEVRNLKNITSLQKIEDWKFLSQEKKEEILEKLELSIPSNTLSKISYLIPGQKNKWLDEKFFNYVKELTDSYENQTQTDVKNKNI